jgi:hypothetical protein
MGQLRNRGPSASSKSTIEVALLQVSLTGVRTRKVYVDINLEFIQEFLKFVNGSNEKLKFKYAKIKVAKSRKENLFPHNERN